MNFSFLLLNLSAMMVFSLFIFTLTVKRRNHIYYVFLAVLFSMIAWTIGNIFAWYWFKMTGILVMPFVKIWYLGTCYLPVLLYLTGILFNKNRSRLNWWHSLFFLPPTISYLTLLTNDINGGLFYRHFSLTNTEIIFGPVLYFHTIISYVYIGLAIYHFLSFSIRSAGLFSRQSLLTFTAVLFPLIVNIIITLRIANLPVYYTSIAFTVTVCLFFLSIIKYQFLNVTPIAMQTILDRMSDGFIVINDKNITYFNKAFSETFKSLTPKLMDNLYDIFQNITPYSNIAINLEKHIKATEILNNSVSFDQALILDGEERHFQIEITPINIPETTNFWGLLVFFKDTTQIQKANEIIRHNETMLIEQQHLASLGQLIGGIAHNLRTPIMSISGGLEALRDLTNEYQISIGDDSVTNDDHKEIASEMLEWINKTKPFCSYMSDIISAVKDQAVRLNESSMSKFMLGELLKRVDLLMKHELKKGHCKLYIDNRMSPETELPGTMNNLIQILGNIIVNAIEAYEDTEGRIDLIVEPCHITHGHACISIRDYGPGIPESVRERVLKEMTTSKGKKGTGIGLYLSYLTIKGKFGGNMWFETATNQGTTFHISVPTIKTGVTGGKHNEEKTS